MMDIEETTNLFYASSRNTFRPHHLAGVLNEFDHSADVTKAAVATLNQIYDDIIISKISPSVEAKIAVFLPEETSLLLATFPKQIKTEIAPLADAPSIDIPTLVQWIYKSKPCVKSCVHVLSNFLAKHMAVCLKESPTEDTMEVSIVATIRHILLNPDRCRPLLSDYLCLVNCVLQFSSSDVPWELSNDHVFLKNLSENSVFPTVDKFRSHIALHDDEILNKLLLEPNSTSQSLIRSITTIDGKMTYFPASYSDLRLTGIDMIARSIPIKTSNQSSGQLSSCFIRPRQGQVFFETTVTLKPEANGRFPVTRVGLSWKGSNQFQSISIDPVLMKVYFDVAIDGRSQADNIADRKQIIETQIDALASIFSPSLASSASKSVPQKDDDDNATDQEISVLALFQDETEEKPKKVEEEKKNAIVVIDEGEGDSLQRLFSDNKEEVAVPKKEARHPVTPKIAAMSGLNRLDGSLWKKLLESEDGGEYLVFETSQQESKTEEKKPDAVLDSQSFCIVCGTSFGNLEDVSDDWIVSRKHATSAASTLVNKFVITCVVDTDRGSLEFWINGRRTRQVESCCYYCGNQAKSSSSEILLPSDWSSVSPYMMTQSTNAVDFNINFGNQPCLHQSSQAANAKPLALLMNENHCLSFCRGQESIAAASGLDGTMGYMTGTSSKSAGFSVECIVRPTHIGDFIPIFSQASEIGSFNHGLIGFQFGLSPTGHVVIQCLTIDSCYEYFTIDPIKLNEWVQISLVVWFKEDVGSEVNLRTYLNGKQLDVSKSVISAVNVQQVESGVRIGSLTDLGKPCNWQHNFIGDVAEVRLWSSPITSGQVRAFVGRLSLPMTASMITSLSALWTCDQGFGNLLNSIGDKSGSQQMNSDLCWSFCNMSNVALPVSENSSTELLVKKNGSDLAKTIISWLQKMATCYVADDPAGVSKTLRPLWNELASCSVSSVIEPSVLSFLSLDCVFKSLLNCSEFGDIMKNTLHLLELQLSCVLQNPLSASAEKLNVAAIGLFVSSLNPGNCLAHRLLENLLSCCVVDSLRQSAWGCIVENIRIFFPTAHSMLMLVESLVNGEEEDTSCGWKAIVTTKFTEETRILLAKSLIENLKYQELERKSTGLTQVLSSLLLSSQLSASSGSFVSSMSVRSVDSTGFYCPRNDCRVVARVGDLVTRGPHWCYSEQDVCVLGASPSGKLDKSIGVIIEMLSWKTSSAKMDAVRVVWPSGCMNIYRYGHIDDVKEWYDVSVLVSYSNSSSSNIGDAILESKTESNEELPKCVPLLRLNLSPVDVHLALVRGISDMLAKPSIVVSDVQFVWSVICKFAPMSWLKTQFADSNSSSEVADLSLDGLANPSNLPIPELLSKLYGSLFQQFAVDYWREDAISIVSSQDFPKYAYNVPLDKESLKFSDPDMIVDEVHVIAYKSLVNSLKLGAIDGGRLLFSLLLPMLGIRHAGAGLECLSNWSEAKLVDSNGSPSLPFGAFNLLFSTLGSVDDDLLGLFGKCTDIKKMLCDCLSKLGYSNQPPVPTVEIEKAVAANEVKAIKLALVTPVKDSLDLKVLFPRANSTTLPKKGIIVNRGRVFLRTLPSKTGTPSPTPKASSLVPPLSASLKGTWLNICLLGSMAVGSGVYRWFVRLDNVVSPTGEDIALGVCKQSKNKYLGLGYDGDSWGILLNGNVMHAGIVVASGYGNSVDLKALKVISVTFDAVNGQLMLGDAVSNTSFGPALPLTNLVQLEVFPAISMYYPGDALTILSSADPNSQPPNDLMNGTSESNMGDLLDELKDSVVVTPSETKKEVKEAAVAAIENFIGSRLESTKRLKNCSTCLKLDGLMEEKHQVVSYSSETSPFIKQLSQMTLVGSPSQVVVDTAKWLICQVSDIRFCGTHPSKAMVILQSLTLVSSMLCKWQYLSLGMARSVFEKVNAAIHSLTELSKSVVKFLSEFHTASLAEDEKEEIESKDNSLQCSPAAVLDQCIYLSCICRTISSLSFLSGRCIRTVLDFGLCLPTCGMIMDAEKSFKSRVYLPFCDNRMFSASSDRFSALPYKAPVSRSLMSWFLNSSLFKARSPSILSEIVPPTWLVGLHSILSQVLQAKSTLFKQGGDIMLHFSLEIATTFFGMLHLSPLFEEFSSQIEGLHVRTLTNMLHIIPKYLSNVWRKLADFHSHAKRIVDDNAGLTIEEFIADSRERILFLSGVSLSWDQKTNDLRSYLRKWLSGLDGGAAVTVSIDSAIDSWIGRRFDEVLEFVSDVRLPPVFQMDCILQGFEHCKLLRSEFVEMLCVSHENWESASSKSCICFLAYLSDAFRSSGQLLDDPSYPRSEWLCDTKYFLPQIGGLHRLSTSTPSESVTLMSKSQKIVIQIPIKVAPPVTISIFQSMKFGDIEGDNSLLSSNLRRFVETKCTLIRRLLKNFPRDSSRDFWQAAASVSCLVNSVASVFFGEVELQLETTEQLVLMLQDLIDFSFNYLEGASSEQNTGLVYDLYSVGLICLSFCVHLSIKQSDSIFSSTIKNGFDLLRHHTFAILEKLQQDRKVVKQAVIIASDKSETKVSFNGGVGISCPKHRLLGLAKISKIFINRCVSFLSSLSNSCNESVSSSCLTRLDICKPWVTALVTMSQIGNRCSRADSFRMLSHLIPIIQPSSFSTMLDSGDLRQLLTFGRVDDNCLSTSDLLVDWLIECAGGKLGGLDSTCVDIESVSKKPAIESKAAYDLGKVVMQSYTKCSPKEFQSCNSILDASSILNVQSSEAVIALRKLLRTDKWQSDVLKRLSTAFQNGIATISKVPENVLVWMKAGAQVDSRLEKKEGFAQNPLESMPMKKKLGKVPVPTSSAGLGGRARSRAEAESKRLSVEKQRLAKVKHADAQAASVPTDSASHSETPNVYCDFSSLISFRRLLGALSCLGGSIDGFYEGCFVRLPPHETKKIGEDAGNRPEAEFNDRVGVIVRFDAEFMNARVEVSRFSPVGIESALEDCKFRLLDVSSQIFQTHIIPQSVARVNEPLDYVGSEMYFFPLMSLMPIQPFDAECSILCSSDSGRQVTQLLLSAVAAMLDKGSQIVDSSTQCASRVAESALSDTWCIDNESDTKSIGLLPVHVIMSIARDCGVRCLSYLLEDCCILESAINISRGSDEVKGLFHSLLTIAALCSNTIGLQQLPSLALYQSMTYTNAVSGSLKSVCINRDSLISKRIGISDVVIKPEAIIEEKKEPVEPVILTPPNAAKLTSEEKEALPVSIVDLIANDFRASPTPVVNHYDVSDSPLFNRDARIDRDVSGGRGRGRGRGLGRGGFARPSQQIQDMVDTCVSMGFGPNLSLRALELHDNDLEQAVSFLLSGEGGTEEDATAAIRSRETPDTIFQGFSFTENPVDSALPQLDGGLSLVNSAAAAARDLAEQSIALDSSARDSEGSILQDKMDAEDAQVIFSYNDLAKPSKIDDVACLASKEENEEEIDGLDDDEPQRIMNLESKKPITIDDIRKCNGYNDVRVEMLPDSLSRFHLRSNDDANENKLVHENSDMKLSAQDSGDQMDQKSSESFADFQPDDSGDSSSTIMMVNPILSFPIAAFTTHFPISEIETLSESIACLYPGVSIAAQEILSNPCGDGIDWVKFRLSEIEHYPFFLHSHISELGEPVVYSPMTNEAGQQLLCWSNESSGDYPGDNLDGEDGSDIGWTSTQPSSPCVVFSSPRKYIITSSHVWVRSSFELSSSRLIGQYKKLNFGTVVIATEELLNMDTGSVRLHITQPADGWISKKFFNVMRCKEISESVSVDPIMSFEVVKEKLGEPLLLSKIDHKPTVEPISESKITVPLKSMELLRGSEDKMHCLSGGTELYRKEDRHFNDRQGQDTRLTSYHHLAAKSLLEKQNSISQLDSCPVWQCWLRTSGKSNVIQAWLNLDSISLSSCFEILENNSRNLVVLLARKSVQSMLYRGFLDDRFDSTLHCLKGWQELDVSFLFSSVFRLICCRCGAGFGGSAMTSGLSLTQKCLDPISDSTSLNILGKAIAGENFSLGLARSWNQANLSEDTNLRSQNSCMSIVLKDILTDGCEEPYLVSDCMSIVCEFIEETSSFYSFVLATMSRASEETTPPSTRSFRTGFLLRLLSDISCSIRLAVSTEYDQSDWSDSFGEVLDAGESFGDENAEGEGKPKSALQTDVFVSSDPALYYIRWLSSILCDISVVFIKSASLQQNEVRGCFWSCTFVSLFEMWRHGLKSGNMSMRHLSALFMSEMLERVRDVLTIKRVVENFANAIATSVLSITPISAIRKLASVSVDYELENYPIYSRYLQSIVELLSLHGIVTDLTKSSDSSVEDITISESSLDSSQRTVMQFSKESRVVFKSSPSDFLLGVPAQAEKKIAIGGLGGRGRGARLAAVAAAAVNPVGIFTPSTLALPWTLEFYLCRDADVEIIELEVEQPVVTPLVGVVESKLTESETVKPLVSTRKFMARQILCGSDAGDCSIYLAVGGFLTDTLLNLAEASNVDEKKEDVPTFDSKLEISRLQTHSSVGISGSYGNYQCFNYICPCKKWVHFSFVMRTASTTFTCPSGSYVSKPRLELYIDGILQDYVEGKFSLPADFIGQPNKARSDTRSFEGKVAEIRVWNYERTSAAIMRDLTVDVVGMMGLAGHMRIDNEDFVLPDKDAAKSSVGEIKVEEFLSSNSTQSIWSITDKARCKQFEQDMWLSDNIVASSSIQGSNVLIVNCLLASVTSSGFPYDMLQEQVQLEAIYEGSDTTNRKRFPIIECVGSATRPSINGVFSEIVALTYRKLQSVDESKIDIEGFLEFTESETKAFIRGFMYRIADACEKSGECGPGIYQIEFAVTQIASTSGLSSTDEVGCLHPLSMAWIEGSYFSGSSNELTNELVGEWSVPDFVLSTLPMPVGGIRLDLDKSYQNIQCTHPSFIRRQNSLKISPDHLSPFLRTVANRLSHSHNVDSVQTLWIDAEGTPLSASVPPFITANPVYAGVAVELGRHPRLRISSIGEQCAAQQSIQHRQIINSAAAASAASSVHSGCASFVVSDEYSASSDHSIPINQTHHIFDEELSCYQSLTKSSSQSELSLPQVDEIELLRCCDEMANDLVNDLLSDVDAADYDCHFSPERSSIAEENKHCLAVGGFGVCRGKWWWEFKIDSASDGLGIGLCNSVASMSKNLGSDVNGWSYTASGSLFHNGEVALEPCENSPFTKNRTEGFSVNDIVGVKLDLESNVLDFYKNGKQIPHTFHGIIGKDKDRTNADGLRPCVFLSSSHDRVTMLGNKELLHESHMTYFSNDLLGRKSFDGHFYDGKYCGSAKLAVQGCQSYWMGCWINGKQDGVQLWAQKDQITSLASMQSKSQKKKLDKKRKKQEEAVSNSEEIEKSVSSADKLKSSRFDVESDFDVQDQIPRGITRRERHMRHYAQQRKPVWKKKVSDFGVVPFIFSNGVCVRRATDEEAFDAMSEWKSEIHDCSIPNMAVSPSEKDVVPELPLDKQLPKVGSEDNSSNNTPAMDSLSGVSEPTPSAIVPDADIMVIKDILVDSTETVVTDEHIELNKRIHECTAPWLLKIIYAEGATVRSGLEIDDNPQVGHLRHGDIVDAFERTVTHEGIPRFRLNCGWISERLRGVTEDQVTETLKEVNEFPVRYKVVRKLGTKIRRHPSLDSEELAMVPFDTILISSERRVQFPERTTRLRIVSPECFVGWASLKKDLLEEINESPEIAIAAALSTGYDWNANKSDSQNKLTQTTRRDSIKNDNNRKLVIVSKMRQDIERQNALINMISACVREGRPIKDGAVIESNGRSFTCKPVTGSIKASSKSFFLLNRRQCNPGIQVSEDFKTATCEAAVGRPMVLGSRGFTRGVHYWEVKILATQWGSVFIGVSPRNRTNWEGYGFINYRATQAFGQETLYGTFFSVGDTVGVLLDMDHGTISFVRDGEDFNRGKSVVNNMGTAYHYLRRDTRSQISNDPGEHIPFWTYPISASTPCLYPCFGMKGVADSLSIEASRYFSWKSAPPTNQLRESLLASRIFFHWQKMYNPSPHRLPVDILRGMYSTYLQWRNRKMHKFATRAGGVEVEVDRSFSAVSLAVGSISDSQPVHAGDRFTSVYGEGKILGVARGDIWFSIDGEDDGRAWYWSTEQFSDVVNSGLVSLHGGVSTSLITEHSSNLGEPLPDNIRRDVSDAVLGNDDLSSFPLSSSSVHLKRSESQTVYQDSTGGKDEILSMVDFSHALSSADPSSVWTQEEDMRIVDCVNRECSKQNIRPSHLRLKDLIRTFRLSLKDASKEHCRHRSDHEIEARFAGLYTLNRAALWILPFADMGRRSPLRSLVYTEIDEAAYRCVPGFRSLGTSNGSGLGPSTIFGGLVSNMRAMIFTSTKMKFWHATIEETTTYTTPPGDEYERPDGVPELVLNRMIAKKAMEKSNELKQEDILSKSLFGQIEATIQGWAEHNLRRSFVHTQDQGQERAFFVKFSGEGVDDHGGPYRAVFTTGVGEEPWKLLSFLKKCPNGEADVGNNRDLLVLNHSADDYGSDPQRMGHFLTLGKLLGIACRHHIMIPFPVSSIVWKSWCGLPLNSADIECIDKLFVNNLSALLHTDSENSDQDTTISTISGLLGSRSDLSLSLFKILASLSTRLQLDGGEENKCDDRLEITDVKRFREKLALSILSILEGPNNLENCRLEIGEELLQYIRILRRECTMNSSVLSSCKKMEQDALIRRHCGFTNHWLFSGLSQVIPTELFCMFTPRELEELICGVSDIDINLLKQVTEYDVSMSVGPEDQHIKYLWECLSEMSPEERSSFVSFCSGRSRLPSSASEFKMNFKITAPSQSSPASMKPDLYLPHAQTCFFSLILPRYSSKEILRMKLLYAINNAFTMDADYLLRAGDGWENVTA